MTYELAKKLKDAGFPQRGHNYDEGGDRVYADSPFIEGDMKSGGTIEPLCYIPTLSELIEACGDIYKEDGKEYEFALTFCKGDWFAGYSDLNFNPPKLPDGRGKTLEEAVANLWLELNKK